MENPSPPGTIKYEFTSTLKMGGRGFDSISEVKKHGDRFDLYVEAKHGPRQVASLDTSKQTLSMMGDSRVYPFAKLELDEKSVKELSEQLQSKFNIKTQ